VPLRNLAAKSSAVLSQETTDRVPAEATGTFHDHRFTSGIATFDQGARKEAGVPGVKPGAPASFSLRDLCALRALCG